jgi:hypothetical protein
LGYFKDISFKRDGIHVATTGFIIPINRSLLKSAWASLKIYGYFKKRQFFHIFSAPKSNGTLAFHPQNPGPWYNIWQVSRLANLKTEADFNTADYIFIFEDSTQNLYDQSFADHRDVIKVNARVNDISKTHVANIFEKTFGYALHIDPLTYEGPAIRKSDNNGTHDGIVINCPIDQDDLLLDCVYQRLVDTTYNEGTSEDWRVAYVLGKIALVYHKYKPLDDMFGTHYLSVDVYDDHEVFSENEIRLITEFCENMGLDFGAIDVMRDKHDGRIYIVDVNKTGMPVLCLSLKTQIKCQQKIADALIQGLGQRSV